MTAILENKAERPANYSRASRAMAVGRPSAGLHFTCHFTFSRHLSTATRQVNNTNTVCTNADFAL
jgi:hypothetical protein